MEQTHIDGSTAEAAQTLRSEASAIRADFAITAFALLDTWAAATRTLEESRALDDESS